MKRLFKIVVVICPLVNLGLLILLAAKNPSPEMKENKSQPNHTPEVFQAVNSGATDRDNVLSASTVHSSTRLYFVEYKDCLEE